MASFSSDEMLKQDIGDDLREEGDALLREVETMYSDIAQHAAVLSKTLHEKTIKAFQKFVDVDSDAVQQIEKNHTKIRNLVACLLTSVLDCRQYMASHYDDEAARTLTCLLEDLTQLLEKHRQASTA